MKQIKKIKACFPGIISLILLFSIAAKGVQPAEKLPNEDVIYKDFIRTVLLYKDGFEMSSPVISLNSGDKLKLSFDDLDSDLKRYKYTIIHCEADWKTSGELMINDFIDGYREDDIRDFSYSYNTTTHYTHFSLLFPNENMRPRVSGNYLLVVFINDPENVAFTRRFMVAETTPVGITAEVHQASPMAERLSMQEIDFSVHLNGMHVSDPFREIRVVITQNDRWDNAIRNLKPKFLTGNDLDYNYDGENDFNGVNEFRSFDTKSLIYQTERIRRMEYDSAGNEVYLLDDLKRPTKNYASETDINGRRLVKNEEHAENSDIEADYTWVHFFLLSNPAFASGKVYILGALTDWRLDEKSEMRYNTSRKGYEINLFLKQGYYNYIYVVKDLRSGKADERPIEGSHWETENEYTIWVYYHETGSLYDRLVAMQNVNSVKKP